MRRNLTKGERDKGKILFEGTFIPLQFMLLFSDPL